ncbi:MAG: anion permease [Halobacteriaceae archaeon]
MVQTLGREFVPPAAFTLRASIGVLLFTGLGVTVGNLLRVSVSTSETAVGAVVGLGAALGVLDWAVVRVVAMWWFLSAVVAFWVSAFVGRYLYFRIAAWLDFGAGERSRLAELAIVGIGCYMAFSAGASNVANAVAPLVGSGQLAMRPGVALGVVAIGAGGFLIGPRTMETIGEGVTELSMEAALVVELVAATIIAALSYAGIPASLAITATMCVIGLGWGRATRRNTLRRFLDPREVRRHTANRGDSPTEVEDLSSPVVNGRIVWAWIVTPTMACVLSYGCFEAALAAGLL